MRIKYGCDACSKSGREMRGYENVPLTIVEWKLMNLSTRLDTSDRNQAAFVYRDRESFQRLISRGKNGENRRFEEERELF